MLFKVVSRNAHAHLVEPASRQFSSISFTAEAGRCTTSPAAMRFTTVASSRWMCAGPATGPAAAAGEDMGALGPPTNCSVVRIMGSVEMSRVSISPLHPHVLLVRLARVGAGFLAGAVVVAAAAAIGVLGAVIAAAVAAAVAAGWLEGAHDR